MWKNKDPFIRVMSAVVLFTAIAGAVAIWNAATHPPKTVERRIEYNAVEEHPFRDSYMPHMFVWHDDKRLVTCYVAKDSTGVSNCCIPDSHVLDAGAVVR